MTPSAWHADEEGGVSVRWKRVSVAGFGSCLELTAGEQDAAGGGSREQERGRQVSYARRMTRNPVQP